MQEQLKEEAESSPQFRLPSLTNLVLD